MKKLVADISTADRVIIEKQDTQRRRTMRNRETGEKRIKPMIKPVTPELDDDLHGLDLRRVTKLADLDIL